MHAVQLRGIGDDFPLIAKRLAAHLIDNAVDVLPDEAGNAGKPGKAMNDPGEGVPHMVAIGVQKRLRIHAGGRQDLNSATAGSAMEPLRAFRSGCFDGMREYSLPASDQIKAACSGTTRSFSILLKPL